MMNRTGHYDLSASQAAMLLTTIDLYDDENGLTIELKRCFEAHIGLRLRHEETRRCLKRSFPIDFSSWSDINLTIRISNEHAGSALRVTIPRLAEALSRIAWRPLTPKLVLIALDISTRERLRWTRDGRLRSSGVVSIQRGNKITVPTYAVSLVEKLAARPEIFMKWRAEDKLFEQQDESEET